MKMNSFLAATAMAMVLFGSHLGPALAEEKNRFVGEDSCFDKWVSAGSPPTFSNWKKRSCADDQNSTSAYEMFKAGSTSAGNNGSGGKKPKPTPPCGLTHYCGNGTGSTVFRIESDEMPTSGSSAVMKQFQVVKPIR